MCPEIQLSLDMQRVTDKCDLEQNCISILLACTLFIFLRLMVAIVALFYCGLFSPRKKIMYKTSVEWLEINTRSKGYRFNKIRKHYQIKCPHWMNNKNNITSRDVSDFVTINRNTIEWFFRIWFWWMSTFAYCQNGFLLGFGYLVFLCRNRNT